MIVNIAMQRDNCYIFVRVFMCFLGSLFVPKYDFMNKIYE